MQTWSRPTLHRGDYVVRPPRMKSIIGIAAGTSKTQVALLAQDGRTIIVKEDPEVLQKLSTPPPDLHLADDEFAAYFVLDSPDDVCGGAEAARSLHRISRKAAAPLVVYWLHRHEMDQAELDELAKVMQVLPQGDVLWARRDDQAFCEALWRGWVAHFAHVQKEVQKALKEHDLEAEHICVGVSSWNDNWRFDQVLMKALREGFDEVAKDKEIEWIGVGDAVAHGILACPEQWKQLGCPANMLFVHFGASVVQCTAIDIEESDGNHVLTQIDLSVCEGGDELCRAELIAFAEGIFETIPQPQRDELVSELVVKMREQFRKRQLLEKQRNKHNDPSKESRLRNKSVSHRFPVNANFRHEAQVSDLDVSRCFSAGLEKALEMAKSQIEAHDIRCEQEEGVHLTVVLSGGSTRSEYVRDELAGRMEWINWQGVGFQIKYAFVHEMEHLPHRDSIIAVGAAAAQAAALNRPLDKILDGGAVFGVQVLDKAIHKEWSTTAQPLLGNCVENEITQTSPPNYGSRLCTPQLKIVVDTFKCSKRPDNPQRLDVKHCYDFLGIPEEDTSRLGLYDYKIEVYLDNKDTTRASLAFYLGYNATNWGPVGELKTWTIPLYVKVGANVVMPRLDDVEVNDWKPTAPDEMETD